MRIIDADALKKAVEEFPNCYNGWSDTYDKAYIIEAIEEAPTIEPKRGEWILERLDNYKEYKVTCSCCGWYGVENYDSYVDISDFYFCPYCNADMRGKDDE